MLAFKPHLAASAHLQNRAAQKLPALEDGQPPAEGEADSIVAGMLGGYATKPAKVFRLKRCTVRSQSATDMHMH